MPDIARVVRPYTLAEARREVREIRNDAIAFRRRVAEFHDREGWKVIGYQSWHECARVEFSEHISHLYRQLEAARIEREVAPEGEIGTIPERHLRPLAYLPEGERKAAYDEAAATAPGGKLTGDHVESVVARRAGVEPFMSTEDVVAEPRDIAAQRRKGIIPEGVEVTVTEPAPLDPADVDEGDDVQAEQTDEEYLSACPCRASLTDVTRKVFDRDALLYRSLTPAREKFANVARLHLPANRKAGRTGNYHYRVTSFLKLADPKHWLVCKDCDGSGRMPVIGECPTCHALGYIAR